MMVIGAEVSLTGEDYILEVSLCVCLSVCVCVIMHTHRHI